MEAFTVHTGRAVPLRRSNVDTDQIIPAVWLKQVSRTGFERGLFSAWREDPGFVLNDPAHEGASILVAGEQRRACRERMVVPVGHALRERSEHIVRDALQPFRKMPCNHEQQQRVASHRIVVDLARRGGCETGARDQSLGITILAHQVERGGDPCGGQILLPLAAITFFEALAGSGDLGRHALPPASP